MKILFSSGEVSGDRAGAALVRAMRARQPALELFGVGGRRLEEAGVAIDFATNHLGTVGVSEALVTLPALRRAFAAIRRRVREDPPEVAVLIANDVFNVLLGRWLRARGIPTVAYFPPQVWIWGSLARLIVGSFDLILTCFPAEQLVYGRAAEGRGTTVTFVSHYLAEELTPRTPADIAQARRRLLVAEGCRVIGLLPGSRRYELTFLLPVLLQAAARLLDEAPASVFLLPIAEAAFRPSIEREVARHSLGGRLVIVDSSHEAIRASDLLLLASGTASLEAALLDVPMVILYKVQLVTLAVVRLAIAVGLIDSDTVGLPNLILGRRVFPELQQSRTTVKRVVMEARAILEDPLRREQEHGACVEVAQRLAVTGSLERAADAVLGLAAAHAGRACATAVRRGPGGIAGAGREGS